MRSLPRPPSAVHVVPLALGTSLLGGHADAHPFGDRYAAQRLDVGLYVDRIEVLWRADAPRALLPQHDGRIDETRLTAELPTGLVATLDGVTLAPDTIEVRPLPELNSEHGYGVEVRTRYAADLRGDHELTVSNGNLGGTPSFHLVDATIPAGVVIHASSLWAEPQGLRKIDLSDRWSRAESRRRLSLTWTWPTSPGAMLWHHLGPPRLRLVDHHPETLWASWWRGVPKPMPFALALGGHLVLGAASGAASLGRRTAPLAVAACGVAVASGGLGVGSTVLLLAVAAGLDPRIALAVAAGAWARPWSAWLVAAGVIGALWGSAYGGFTRWRVGWALALATALATHGRSQPPPVAAATAGTPPSGWTGDAAGQE